jgi:hypothetical protein
LKLTTVCYSNVEMAKKSTPAVGRPPKFLEPRRPVTMVLPESTLARLEALDSDRARAVVKATDAAIPSDPKSHSGVEIVEILPGVGIIVVGPSRYLQQIPWLRLVEMAPARYLITIPSGTSVDSLEVAILDMMENIGAEDAWEKSVLMQLRTVIATVRRAKGLSKAEVLFIDTSLEELQDISELSKVRTLVEPSGHSLHKRSEARKAEQDRQERIERYFVPETPPAVRDKVRGSIPLTPARAAAGGEVEMQRRRCRLLA